MTSRRQKLAFVLAAIAIAAVGVFIAYGGQLFTGLYYDDYHFVRPLTARELGRVWTGSWDPTGLESLFYRPLTAWLFAGRFWLFGINADAMHAVSAAGHVACATLVALFLRRERVPQAVCLLASGVYAIYPTFPWAQVSWLTNQMHLAESLVVLAALLAWQTARDRSLVWWLPIAGCAVIAFLIKEDGIMLLPAIGALTLVRWWGLGRTLPKSWPWLLGASVSLVFGLIYFRYAQLGRLGGYGEPPSLEAGYTNFWKGLSASIALWPTRRPWQGVASVMALVSMSIAAIFGWRKALQNRSALVAGAALAAWLCFDVHWLFQARPGNYPLMPWQAIASGVAVSLLSVGATTALIRRDRIALLVMLGGIAIAFAFDLPFVLVSKRQQFHLLSLGGVIALAGACQAIVTTGVRPIVKGAVWVVLIGAMTPLALLARDQAADFRPCAENVLLWDTDATGWVPTGAGVRVPDEIKTWLSLKAQQCSATQSAPPITDVAVATWGVFPEEGAGTAEPYRWTTDRAVVLLRKATASVTFAFRRPGATAQSPVRVMIDTAGTAQEVTLDSSEWKYATVPLSSGVLSWLRAGHRVDVQVSPTFQPGAVDRANTDLRHLGVRMRVLLGGR